MSNDTEKLPQAALTYDEAKFAVMAMSQTLENLEGTLKNQKIPWTPDSRKVIKDMIAAGTSARVKICSLTGINPDMPDLEPGEEDDYITKPS